MAAWRQHGRSAVAAVWDTRDNAPWTLRKNETQNAFDDDHESPGSRPSDARRAMVPHPRQGHPGRCAAGVGRLPRLSPPPRTVDDGLHMHGGPGRHRELRTCHQGPPIHGRLHSLGTRKSYRLLGLKPGFPTAFSGHAEILIGHPIDGLGGFPKRHGPSPGIHPRNAAVLGILNDSHNQSSNAEMPNERGYKDSHG